MPDHPGATFVSTLKAAITDSALAATEHQMHLASTLGKRPRWRLVEGGATAEFVTRHGSIITATVHPIATLDKGHWTWAWADERTAAAHCAAALQVKAYGDAHTVTAFTRPVSDLSDWRVSTTPNDIITATKVIHRLWHHFVFILPGGLELYAALQLNLPLPTSTPATVAQTLHTTETLLPISNRRRALVSYSNIRGLPRQEHRSGRAMRLLTDAGPVQISWDDLSYRIPDAPAPTRPQDKTHALSHHPRPR